jgi:hypothetical protein
MEMSYAEAFWTVWAILYVVGIVGLSIGAIYMNRYRIK